MSFNSIEFFVFLAVVLAVYFRFGRANQNRLMVAGGALFYGLFDWRFLLLLYGSVVVDFTTARQIEKAGEDQRRRKLLLLLSVAFNLGVLGFFKYFDFFAESVTDLFSVVGLEADPFTVDILLPVGISFYTFQSIAYVVAVYRRELKAERDIITFAAFVSWFPQLVAGPIERPGSLLPQIQRQRARPSGPVIESALVLIVRGLFKKVVIADSVAAYVNAVYAAPGAYQWSAVVFATAGFAVQVYGDFSGYTDIARGTSRLLGVELRRNFEQPFLSRDIREFWTRWHTALSWWFVEMVARPLGGATRGRRWATFTVVLIFTFTGLWHGAAWTFVVWGFFNGLLVVVWRRLPTPKKQHPMRLRLVEAPRIAFTFGVFCLGVTFFRASSIRDAVEAIRQMVTFGGGLDAPSQRITIVFAILAVLVLDLIERRRRIEAIETLRVRATLGGVASADEAVAESMTARMNPLTSGLVIGVMLLGIAIFSGGTPTPFIYFQF